MRYLPSLKHTLLLAIVTVMAIALLGGLPGCTTVRWSLQAVGGHVDLLSRRESIGDLIAAEDTAPALRKKLLLAQRIRDFASTRLGLPDNDSYRSYADLQREAVVWNVIATPPLSLQAQTWCYPLVGCLAYRGWYRRDAALAEAQILHAEQRDVLVSPATAYSTLGWFDDPLLNTMLAYNDNYLEPILASLIFHELAHQQLFASGDTGFNEAFAETVALAGVQRWLQINGNDALQQRWQAQQKARHRVNDLLSAARVQLVEAYSGQASEELALRAKEQIFIDLRRAYLNQLAALEGGFEYEALRAWRDWFAQPLNNAHLALHSTYQDGVVVFQKLLDCVGDDLSIFYAAAANIAAWSGEERSDWLKGNQILSEQACAGT